MVGAEGLPGDREGTGRAGATQAPTQPPPGQGRWQRSGPRFPGGGPPDVGAECPGCEARLTACPGGLRDQTHRPSPVREGELSKSGRVRQDGGGEGPDGPGGGGGRSSQRGGKGPAGGLAPSNQKCRDRDLHELPCGSRKVQG